MGHGMLDNLNRTFFGVTALASIAFTIVIGWPELKKFVWINQQVAAAVADEPVDAPKGPWSTPNVSVYPNAKVFYRSLLNFERMYFTRSVSATIFVPNDRLRGPDGRPVEPEQRYQTARALAGELAERECRLLTETLAKSCKVMSGRANSRREAGYIIRLSLLFVQKDDFGRVYAQDGLEFAIKRVKLNAGQKSVTSVALQSQEHERRRHYERARRACADVRAEAGNCALQGVSILGNFDYRNGIVRTRGVATVSSLRLP